MLSPSHIAKSLILTVLLTIGSCKKKYPDGPLLSFSSKLNRVAANWELRAAVVNGEGKMSYTGFATCLIKITDNKEYAVQWEEKGQEMNTLGTWKWVDRKKYIRFTTDLWFYKFDASHNLTFNTYNNSQLTNTTYRVNKLTEDQLWLEHNTENGDHVELYFRALD